MEDHAKTQKGLRTSAGNKSRRPNKKRPVKQSKGSYIAGRAGVTAYQSVIDAEKHLAEKKSVDDFFVIPPTLFVDDTYQVMPDTVPWLHTGLLDANDATRLGIQIVLPEAGRIRARDLIGRSRHIATGVYPSWKMGRLMQWESRVEANVFRLLDICPAITRFAEQPLTIHYLRDGKWHIHIPDVAVETCFGQRLILEVKSTKDRKLHEALERAELIAPALKLMGCHYLVIHQQDVEASRSVANANLLLKLGRKPPSASSHQKFLDLLELGSPLNRKELLGKVINDEHAIYPAAQLVLRGHLSPSWQTANSAEISFCKKNDDNLKESLQWLLHALGAINRL